MQRADRVHLHHQGVCLFVPYFFLRCELSLLVFQLVAQQLVRPDEAVVGFFEQLEQLFGCCVRLVYRTGLQATAGARSCELLVLGSPL